MFLGGGVQLGGLVLILVCVGAIAAATIAGRPEPVSLTVVFARSPDAVRSWIVTSLYRYLRGSRYEITAQSDRRIVLERTYCAPSTWFFAIVFIPVGLVLLLAFRRSSQVTLLIRPVGEGSTELLISGELPRAIARELAAIATQASQLTPSS